MAANGMFGAGKDGMINPPDPSKSFTLAMAEIAVFSREAYKVICDLKLLLSIIKVSIIPFHLLKSRKYERHIQKHDCF